MEYHKKPNQLLIMLQIIFSDNLELGIISKYDYFDKVRCIELYQNNHIVNFFPNNFSQIPKIFLTFPFLFS